MVCFRASRVVHRVVAQIPWRPNIALLERLGDAPAGERTRFQEEWKVQAPLFELSGKKRSFS